MITTTRCMSHLLSYCATSSVCLASVLILSPAAKGGNQLYEFGSTNASSFGQSVALSSNQSLVGSPTGIAGTDPAGAAYLYDNATGQQTLKLTPSDGVVGDGFGLSVALSNSAAIASSLGSPSLSSGSAYIFDKTSGTQLFKLKASDATTGMQFGASLAASGDKLIVGANGSATPGAAYLFDVSTGQQLKKLTPSDGLSDDEFGSTVGIDGDLAVVGAMRHHLFSNQNIQDGGAVYVFNTTTGQQTLELRASDEKPFDFFGSAVAIGNNRVIVGSSIHGTATTVNSGIVYVFDATTGQQLYTLSAPNAVSNGSFGTSVAINGNLALIGAFGINDHSAYAFDLTTGAFLDRFVASDAQPDDWFGKSVAISSNLALVGAFEHNFRSHEGAAYLFGMVPEPSTAVLGWPIVFAIGIFLRRRIRAQGLQTT